MSVIDFKTINTGNMALYLNFPFCKLPCSYCHYVDNLCFGYSAIPDDYFSEICTQLVELLDNFDTPYFKSIYLGGGTPSLLNDIQINQIQGIFNNYNVHADEICIELHPGMCNFDVSNNDFFTRYSIGVQSFDKSVAESYRRTSYNSAIVTEIINKIRSAVKKKYINIDLVFDERISIEDFKVLSFLAPESITIYPNTRGRGTDRLRNVLTTLLQARNALIEYHPLAKSRFIFLGKDSMQSEYSKLEYETLGDIIGLGHNSVSYIGDTSFLCLYSKNEIIIKERDNHGSRYLSTLLSGINSGITKDDVMTYMPAVYSQNFLYTIDYDIVVTDKHISVRNNDLIYLPEEEYLRFYKYLSLNFDSIYAKTFLSSIGFGDSDYNVINRIYNNEYAVYTKNFTEVVIFPKIKAPDMKILIEGIDGSGKDTFARLLVKELKKRFVFSEDSKISVLGQPDSKLDFGMEAKKFIEDVSYTGTQEDVAEILTRNRIASEKKIMNLPGIKILIRGIGTDKATYYKIFNTLPALGEDKVIGLWDELIIVDVDPSEADQRIEKRGIPRTWRESLENLTYFREFYLNYKNDDLFGKKTVIYNHSFDKLIEIAKKVAGEIYDRSREKEHNFDSKNGRYAMQYAMRILL